MHIEVHYGKAGLIAAMMLDDIVMAASLVLATVENNQPSEGIVPHFGLNDLILLSVRSFLEAALL